MSELGREIVLRSQDRYERSVRWGCLLVVVGLALHATVFSQTIGVSWALERNRSNQQALATADNELSDLSSGLQKFEQETTGFLGKALDQMVGGMKAEFRAVNEVLKNRLAGESRPSSSPVAQHPRRPEALREKLNEHLGDAKDISELEEPLIEFVNAEIIDPAFEDLNDSWQDQLSALEQQTTELNRGLVDAQDSVPWRRVRDLVDTEDLPNLEAIRQQLQDALARAQDLTFEPPGNNEWWLTVDRKIQTIELMHENVQGQLEGVSAVRNQVQRAVQNIGEAREDQQAVHDRIQEAKKNLEKQFKQQKQQLAGMAKPFQFLAGDVVFFASRFPLLLGLLLVVALVWVSARRAGLVRALGLLSADDESETHHRLWRQYGEIQTFHPAALAFLVAALIWIAITTIQLAIAPLAALEQTSSELAGPSQTESVWGAVRTGLGGIIAVLAAFGYRYFVFRSISIGAFRPEAGKTHEEATL